MSLEDFARRGVQAQAAVREATLMAEVLAVLKLGGITATITPDGNRHAITVPIGDTITLHLRKWTMGTAGEMWCAAALYADGGPALTTADIPKPDVPGDCVDAEQIAVYLIRCLFRYGQVYGEKRVPQYLDKTK